MRFALTLLLGAGLASAHMTLQYPPPINSKYDPQTPETSIDYSYTAPLDANGDNYLCKGYNTATAYETLSPVATLTAGGSLEVMFASGGTTHNGGSCQFSISYDQGVTFAVIHSVIGGCPLQQNYTVPIPSDLPSATSATFAWTWQNKVGNREMYGNCAIVDITGSSAKSFTGPGIFRANTFEDGSCLTVENTDYIYPNPGTSVEYGGSVTSSDAATVLSNCDYDEDTNVTISPSGSSSSSAASSAASKTSTSASSAAAKTTTAATTTTSRASTTSQVVVQSTTTKAASSSSSTARTRANWRSATTMTTTESPSSTTTTTTNTSPSATKTTTTTTRTTTTAAPSSSSSSKTSVHYYIATTTTKTTTTTAAKPTSTTVPPAGANAVPSSSASSSAAATSASTSSSSSSSSGTWLKCTSTTTWSLCDSAMCTPMGSVAAGTVCKNDAIVTAPSSSSTRRMVKVRRGTAHAIKASMQHNRRSTSGH